MPGPDPDATAAAQAALATVLDEWVARRGVVSVEVARRWRAGEPTDEVGIRVTLERILPASDVPSGELFPDEVDGIPVDLVEGTAPAPEA